MEFSHLQTIPMHVLRNRLILLHHFSDLFCKSLTLFGMQPKYTETSGNHEGAFEGFDQLRSLLVSSSKVRMLNVQLTCTLTQIYGSFDELLSS